MLKNNEASVGGAIVFREHRGKKQFLVVKMKENSTWEIPKVNVRRGESSARAVIRFTSEQAGITPQILEEAGRANGTLVVGPKTISQKFYYYLMIERAGGGEVLGFSDFEWAEYAKAGKKITTKREKQMLRNAKNVLKVWEKSHKIKELS